MVVWRIGVYDANGNLCGWAVDLTTEAYREVPATGDVGDVTLTLVREVERTFEDVEG